MRVSFHVSMGASNPECHSSAQMSLYFCILQHSSAYLKYGKNVWENEMVQGVVTSNEMKIIP